MHTRTHRFKNVIMTHKSSACVTRYTTVCLTTFSFDRISEMEKLTLCQKQYINACILIHKTESRAE